MKKKNNKLEFILLLIFIGVLAALLYYYFYYGMNINDDLSVGKIVEIKSNSQYDSQKNNLIFNLSTFKKYGQWPEIPYQLSQGRGNPFTEKSIENN